MALKTETVKSHRIDHHELITENPVGYHWGFIWLLPNC